MKTAHNILHRQRRRIKFFDYKKGREEGKNLIVL